MIEKLAFTLTKWARTIRLFNKSMNPLPSTAWKRSLVTYGWIPRTGRVFPCLQRFHILWCQFKIVHLGVLLDPGGCYRLGKWHETLVYMSVGPHIVAMMQIYIPSVNSNELKSALLFCRTSLPVTVRWARKIGCLSRWDSTLQG